MHIDRETKKEVSLVTARSAFDDVQRQINPVICEPGMKLFDVFEHPQLQGLHHFQCCIILNGKHVVHNCEIKPHDVIHVYRDIHRDATTTLGLLALSVVSFAVVGPAVGGLIGGGLAGSIWGTVASVAMVSIGGMLINSLMPDVVHKEDSDGRESPTFGWNAGSNSSQEGLAIGVLYGNSPSYPQIINQWFEIDSNEDEWAHTLLSVHEGYNANPVTTDNIYLNEEPISVYRDSDYVVSETDGSPNPDTGALSKFQELHQVRRFTKALKYSVELDNNVTLLHLNGSHGSTTIDDLGSVGANWTCQATAALSTTNPFLGSAALDATQSSDWVECDSWAVFAMLQSTHWTVECRWRQSVMQKGGIFGFKSTNPVIGDFFWSFYYENDQLRFYAAHDETVIGGDYDVLFDVTTPTLGLNPNYWYHLCVQRSGDDIYIYVNGALMATDRRLKVIETVVIQSSTQGIATSFEWTGSATNQIFGVCELDEVRILRGQLAYDINGFVPPTTEVALGDGDIATYKTLGSIDKFSVMITAPRGIYSVTNDGDLNWRSVDIQIKYRPAVGGAWTTVNENITEVTRHTKRFQFTYTTTSREPYEVQVIRTSPEPEELNTNAYDQIEWTLIDEVISEFLTYPNLKLVAVSIKAQERLSGQVPTIKVVSDRTDMDVPNFNGVGTQNVPASNNAWVAYDMFTNPIYGIGEDPTQAIESEFLAWRDWCDGLVNGKKRCQFNAIVDGSYSFDKAWQLVENTGRAKIIQRGTNIGVVVEKTASASATYSSGNTLNGILRVLPKADKSDAVEISFVDKDLDWKTNIARAVTDGYNQLSRKPRITKLTMIGINNFDQAQREAIVRQQISDGTRMAVEIQSNIEAVRTIIGDVFNYQHPGNEMMFGGRIVLQPSGDPYVGTTIYLDQTIHMASADYSGVAQLIVRQPDDSEYQVDITGPFDTDTDYVTTASSITVNQFDVFMIVRPSIDIHEFKLISVRRVGAREFQMESVEYNRSNYFNINYEGGAVEI